MLSEGKIIRDILLWLAAQKRHVSFARILDKVYKDLLGAIEDTDK